MDRHVPYDRMLLLVVLALFGVGLVMVFSTSGIDSAGLFARHFVFVVAGLCLMMAMMRVDYRQLSKPAVVYGLVGSTYVLLILALASPPINNVHRWISLGPVRGQPSELAKLVAIVFTAFYIVRSPERIRDLKHGLLPWMAVIGSLGGLIVLEPDFGTASCVVLASGFLIFLSGLRFSHMAAGALALVPVLYVLVVRVPYRWARFTAFLDPDANPLGSGYQIRQSLIAVGSGGLTGLGVAQSRQKMDYLPEAHNDFIFAIVGEELGLLGCGVLVILFLTLFWKGIQISLRADTKFGTLLGLGIVGMIVFQALINMTMVVGLLPTKGIPLPFISVGGSSLLINSIAVGILLSISRSSRRDSSGWTSDKANG